MLSQRLEASLFQSQEAVGRWPIDGPGTRTLCSGSPGPRGTLGKCSRKVGHREERTRKGASEVNSISAMGFPLLSNILTLASKTPWQLALLSHQCHVAALSPHPSLCNQTLCLSLTSPRGLCLYMFPLPQSVWPASALLQASAHSSPVQNDVRWTACPELPPPPHLLFTYHRIPVPIICLLAYHMAKWSPASSSPLGYELSEEGTWLSCSSVCPTTRHALVAWINNYSIFTNSSKCPSFFHAYSHDTVLAQCFISSLLDKHSCFLNNYTGPFCGPSHML